MFIEDDSQSCVEAEPCRVVDDRLDHILIIEDDFMQSDALAHKLNRQGYKTSIATSCADGVPIAQSEHPDLILLDIRLPDGDGLEICSRFFDDKSTSDIPVIIISGLENPDVVRQARAAGCHYFVRKPYDPNALLVLAQNAIAESRAW